MKGLQSENYLALSQVFGVVFLRMLKDKKSLRMHFVNLG